MLRAPEQTKPWTATTTMATIETSRTDAAMAPRKAVLLLGSAEVIETRMVPWRAGQRGGRNAVDGGIGEFRRRQTAAITRKSRGRGGEGERSCWGHSRKKRDEKRQGASGR